MTDTFRCVVERITYHNDENGYTILKVKASGFNELVTVVGNMIAMNVGTVLTVNGEWKINPKYGRQFCATKYEETLPSTALGIEKYLGSGLIKGIGPVYARKIVSFFSDDTLDVIENHPERLIEIREIGKKRVETIKNAWREQKEIRNIMIFLQSNEVGASHATKIYKKYGQQSIEIVTQNPYRLSNDIWGIGFKTADKIAMRLGISKRSYVRCESGILYALNELVHDGHCYAEFEQLIEKVVALLEFDDSPEVVMTYSDMQHNGSLTVDDGIYLPSLYFCEVGTSKLIKQILHEPRKKTIKLAQVKADVQYNDEQLEAIQCASSSKFMVLTGGPGTGKTTTIKGIINVFKASGFKILLAAPTGRAAKRMEEATGLEAKTIHRLLEYKPHGGYNKNENNQLVGDVLIVDEMSMVDIVLMYNLLKAVPKHMTVILIGDVNQLPSIGAGNVLRDVIESKRLPVINLEKIFRQGEQSKIILNAHKINQGLNLDLIRDDKSDFTFIGVNDDSKIPNIISNLCMKYLHSRPNSVEDIQVLCPMQRGIIGSINLNLVLQNVLNKNDLAIKRNGIEYRLGDKVMQIKNNYDKGIFNGDIGIISDINLEDKTFSVAIDGQKISYEASETEELMLAYATTIHKAQGSEYHTVIIPISLSQNIMLQRNLLYTGITRAKTKLILIGSKNAVYAAVKNNKVIERNTRLSERLKIK